jgi:predicted AlkP superfamily phosphohydrolase/phosphomutase
MLAIVQIDAVSTTRLERLLAEGRLPALAALQAGGTAVKLQTPATHLAAASYATLFSGLEPGDHGMYYALQWAPREQRVRFRDRLGPPEPVWGRLDRAGRSSLVVDPYETGPLPLRNGLAVSGWQFQHLMALRPWSVPGGERRRLTRALGRAPRLAETFGRPTPAGLLALRKTVLGASNRVADAVLASLSERFDLVWAVLLATHLGGHWFWDLSQLEEARLDEGTHALLAEMLDQVYIEADAAIGRIAAALPDDADLIVLSPLGMDVNRSRADLMPGMISAVLDGRASEQGGAWALRARIPTRARAAVARALPDAVALAVSERTQLGRVDWSRVRAFAAPSDHGGYVRLNLRGREREGIVDPAEADALRDELAAGLASFRDLDGGAAVAAVDRREDVIERGARFEDLPDLIVRWSEAPATRLRGVSSPEFGEVPRLGAGSGRSGNHNDDAWALLVPRRARLARPSRPARLVDIAATVGELCSVELDGRGEPLLTRA